MSSEVQPQQTASGNGAPNNQEEASQGFTRPSLHVIRIPDKTERVRAIGALLEVNDVWVSTAGNLYGLNTRQVKALQAKGIAFEWVSKTAPHE
jgi:hypothetical protein